MTDKRKELNDKFYKMFDDLNEARPIFNGIDEAFVFFGQNILDKYKSELRLLKEDEEIEEARELYKKHRKRDKVTPQHWRNWKRFFRREQNLAADLLDEEAELEAQQYFSDTLKRLKAQKAEEHEEKKAPEEPEELAEGLSGSVQESVPVTRVQVQQLITVYVAGFIPMSAMELTEGEAQPPGNTKTSEDPEDPEEDQNGDVETEVEEFDDYGIDTEYEIVEEDPGEDRNESRAEEEEAAEEPPKGLVAGETTKVEQVPDAGADELSEDTQGDESIKKEEKIDD
jgi:hypothetical protein